MTSDEPVPAVARPVSPRHGLVLPVMVFLLCLLVPLVFAPWRSQVFAPVKIQLLLAIVGAGMLAAALLTSLGAAPRVRFLPWADGAALAYGLTNVLAFAGSADRTASWRGEFPEYQGLLTVLAYLAAYGLARLAFAPAVDGRSRSMVPLFCAMTVTTGLVGGYAVMQRLGLDPLWGFAERPFATVGQANSMAALLVVGLPGVLAAYAACGRRSRVLVVVAGLLGMAAALMSLSRGGWLALLAAGSVALALSRPHLRRRTLLLGAVIVIALGALAASVPAGRDAVDRAAARVAAATDTKAVSTAKHLALARIGVGIALDHPWLGIGQDVFPEFAQQFADQHLPRTEADLLRPRRSESPHNALLSIADAAGIPALLAYLAFLGVVVRRALHAQRSADNRALPVVMIIIGYVVSSLFMTPEVSSTVTFWVVAGSACSALGA